MPVQLSKPGDSDIGHIDPRVKALRDLEGKVIRIPDLKSILFGWRGITTEYASTHLHELRIAVEKRLRSLYSPGPKLDKLQKADFAWFTALWWPDTSLRHLEILSFLVIWLFTWDDEIDEPTGLCSEDFEAAQGYRRSTLEFVKHHLGLSGSPSTPEPQNAIIQSFDIIGAAMCSFYTDTQRHRFQSEIARFMVSSEQEQRTRLDGRLPSITQYWDFRLGTSAVYVGLAAAEYSIGSCLPDRVLVSRPMRDIWDETNIIISVTNDLLSLRKEIKQGCIDSIVPLTYAQGGDISSAVQKSVAMLQVARSRFDAAANDLLQLATPEQDYTAQIIEFVETCRSNCVGNLIWSLGTARYGVADSMKQDGSLEINL